MPFMHEDFLLDTELARRLYHEHAAPQPIVAVPAGGQAQR